MVEQGGTQTDDTDIELANVNKIRQDGVGGGEVEEEKTGICCSESSGLEREKNMT